MTNLTEINKLINQTIHKIATYNGKRWKRGYHNQVGVYDVKLNINQILIIHEALRNVKYQKHLKKSMKIKDFEKSSWIYIIFGYSDPKHPQSASACQITLRNS